MLDPEQNDLFTDHYLDLLFDPSGVLFIATANQLHTISAPLRDRMEIIEIPGYTMEDKVKIAFNYIVPEQLEAHGITDEHVELTDEGLRFLIESHTREAGVRLSVRSPRSCAGSAQGGCERDSRREGRHRGGEGRGDSRPHQVLQ